MIDWLKNFIGNYTEGMYLPAIEVKDVIEILIITVVLYEIMLWIKNTKAWMLLRGIIMLGGIVAVVWAVLSGQGGFLEAIGKMENTIKK